MQRWMFLVGAMAVTGCWHDHDGCDDPCDRGGPPRLDRRGDRDRDRVRLCRDDDAPDAATVDVPVAMVVDAGTAPARCALDRDCAAAGAGLVCDARSGACVAPAQCTADAQCAAGEQCLTGRCLAPSAVCQFATDCTGGRDCVDGRCLAGCATDAECPATQACVSGRCDRPTTPGGQCARASDCPAGAACADGRCVAACDAARPCAAGQVCVAGFCQVDTAQRSFCTRDADCAAGSVCRRGSCRAACPNGTTEECLRVDVAFDTCGADRLCTNPLELRPECARSADCAAPAACVNARCR